MDSDLVGAPGLQFAGDQARDWLALTVGAEFFQQSPMGDRLAAARLRHDRHFFALDRVAPERRIDGPARAFRRAPADRQIFAGQRQAAAVISEKF